VHFFINPMIFFFGEKKKKPRGATYASKENQLLTATKNSLRHQELKLMGINGLSNGDA